jgi:hypothetical protein
MLAYSFAGNGNAPFYSYWADGSEATKQRVMFAKMWQSDDIENPAAKRLKMVNLIGAYNWVFTDLTNTNSTAVAETVFTMTGRPKQGGAPDSPKPDITFTNHLVSSSNGTELKFDVDIANFDDAWWDASAKGLVMAYRIETVNAADEAKNASIKDVRTCMHTHFWPCSNRERKKKHVYVKACGFACFCGTHTRRHTHTTTYTHADICSDIRPLVMELSWVFSHPGALERRIRYTYMHKIHTYTCTRYTYSHTHKVHMYAWSVPRASVSE